LLNVPEYASFLEKIFERDQAALESLLSIRETAAERMKLSGFLSFFPQPGTV